MYRLSHPSHPYRISLALAAPRLILYTADVAELEFDRKKVSLAEQLGEGKLGPVLRGTATGIVLPGWISLNMTVHLITA